MACVQLSVVHDAVGTVYYWPARLVIIPQIFLYQQCG